MPLFNRDRYRGSAAGRRIPFGISRRQVVPTVLLVAAGVAVSVIISDIPVGVKQAFAVSADASYEEQLYRDFAPADVDVLKEHANAPVREFSVIAGQLAEIKTAVEKTAYDTQVAHAADQAVPVEETQPEPAVPEEPTVIEELIDRSGEVVSSGNRNLYKSNYHYGAASLAYSGGAGLNTSGIPMSELALPASLEFDENGAPKDYLFYIDGIATAYSGGGLTSTGTTVYQGCVAVDPRQIPYGTEMWIVSQDGNYVYGYCRAEDTGGFIYWTDGRNVDLYMHSETDCENWGVRGVRIYVLPASY